MSNGEQWTWNDYCYLYENYPSKGAKACAEALQKPQATVEAKADKLGLTEGSSYTEEEKNLARTYGKILKKSLMFLLPHRTSYQVEELIVCSKLKKQPLPRD